MSKRTKTRRPRPTSAPATVAEPVSVGTPPSGGAWVVGGDGARRSVLVTAVVAHHADPVAALDDLAAIRQELELLTDTYVRRSRLAGLSWDAIGERLDVPGETVRRRCHAHADRIGLERV